MCVGKTIIQEVRPRHRDSCYALVSFSSMYLFGYNLEHVFIQ